MRGLALLALVLLSLMSGPSFARHHDRDGWEEGDYQDDQRDDRRYDRRNDQRYDPRNDRRDDYRGNGRGRFHDNGGQGYLIDPRAFERGRSPGMSPDEAADRARSVYGGRVLRVDPSGDGGRRGYRVRLESNGRVRTVPIEDPGE